MLKKITNGFFEYPILTDGIIVIALLSFIRLYEEKYGFLSVYIKYDKSICSDLGTIGMTLAGFLITIVTILVSFKTQSIAENKTLSESSSAFMIFISSPLYLKTISFFNKSIILLVFVSILSYVLKIFIQNNLSFVLFYCNLASIILIVTTFLRCVMLLKLIVKMQN